MAGLQYAVPISHGTVMAYLSVSLTSQLPVRTHAHQLIAHVLRLLKA